MDRRTLLSRTAAAGAALTLAGCLRSGRDEDVLTVSNTSWGANDEGNFQMTVTVSNPSGREASGTVYATAEVDGEALTRVREVTLQPNSSTVVEVGFGVPFDETSTPLEDPEADIVED